VDPLFQPLANSAASVAIGSLRASEAAQQMISLIAEAYHGRPKAAARQRSARCTVATEERTLTYGEADNHLETAMLS